MENVIRHTNSFSDVTRRARRQSLCLVELVGVGLASGQATVRDILSRMYVFFKHREGLGRGFRGLGEIRPSRVVVGAFEPLAA